jgi:hypothetical protein
VIVTASAAGSGLAALAACADTVAAARTEPESRTLADIARTSLRPAFIDTRI